jgi:transposase-like protein
MTYSTKSTKKELFLKAYRNEMCNISKACDAVNIDRQTFYNWIDKYPNFKKQVEEVNESLTDMAETSLYKNVKAGVQKAVEFYLTNRKKDKYNNNQQLEVIMPKVVKETVFVQSGEPPKIVEEEP